MANRFDIHIQTLPEAEQKETFKFMSFGFESPVGVKGFQMLINTWLRVFLTRKGSDPADLNLGTSFPNLIGSSIPVGDGRDVVALSIDQCNEQIFGFQRNDTTLTTSERLASAELIDYVEKPSDPGFEFHVRIKSQAGERLLLNLPQFADI